MENFLMNKNKIFNSLLHLSGLANDPDLIIQIMANAGYSISLNQIRDWRRGEQSRNYKPVPSFVFDVIFDYLFELKKNGQGQIPTV
ncbi:hypothetical protein ACFGY2_11600 [Pasteurella multocida]|nr:hypothetical protein [Tissierellia bacterium]